MNVKPTLALCIPAYNAAPYLPRLLETASHQTIPFDEIIVYDDASSDNTSEVASDLGAKVIRGEKNAGCSHGKNQGAQNSVCDWVHFHDADDALEPNFVEQAQNWISREDCPDIVFFGFRCVDNATGEELAVKQFDHEAISQDPVTYCFAEQTASICGVYRRSKFVACGGWDEDPDVLYSEDQAGHVHMALSGLTFAADPAITVTNFMRAGSMSDGSLRKCPRSNYHFMNKHWKSAPERAKPKIAFRLWQAAGTAAS
ncbi:MAG: glycosyltransferase family 2 protein, partial [Verrucomicrobiota bacterium]